MHQSKSNILLTISKLWILFFLVLMTSTSYAQQRIIIGAGISPIHQPIQSDFNPFQMPLSVYGGYQKGDIGIRFDYVWKGAYKKERFSFENKAIELSLYYDFRAKLKLPGIHPYVRAGVAKWSTTFTTEGYPGITAYDLKVEQDNGIGAIAAIGTTYDIGNLSIGIEGQYAKYGKAKFIAGGFEARDLVVDQMRLMVTANYSFPISSSRKSGFIVACPKF